MRIRSVLVICGLAGTLAFGPACTGAELTFSAGLEISSAGDFYEPLSPYGIWVDVPSHGRCWHPSRIALDWRPYCNGSWEWTDCGWYWVSDEPWAWACYHYGSWLEYPSVGWIWIPGTEWAPAWVVWRESPDYIGWAPCEPGLVAPPAPFFVFVDVHHFHEPLGPRRVIVNSPAIFDRTTATAGFERETRDFGGVRQRVVIDRGPDVEKVQRLTGAKFTPRPIREVVTRTPVPETIKRRPGWNEIERPHGTPELPREGAGKEGARVQEPPSQPVPPPTGRETPRAPRPEPPTLPPERVQPPVGPERPAPPTTPPERTLPPTGREAPRPEPPTPPPERVQPPAGPERPAPPAVFPEKPLPLTGREGMGERNAPPKEIAPPAVPHPPVREAPPAPPAPGPDERKKQEHEG